VQWVVTPDGNGSCPAPDADVVMALVARMRNDFANFSSDIETVAVTPVNTTSRVSVSGMRIAGGLWPRQWPSMGYHQHMYSTAHGVIVGRKPQGFGVHVVYCL
jgi:hypothetical protein